MVEPINPKDVVAEKQKTLPDQVVEAFNELIAENWRSRSSIVKQKDAVRRIKLKMGLEALNDALWDDNWLNIEEVYRKVGWKVFYDKPAYNETYEPTFEFSKESKK